MSSNPIERMGPETLWAVWSLLRAATKHGMLNTDATAQFDPACLCPMPALTTCGPQNLCAYTPFSHLWLHLSPCLGTCPLHREMLSSSLLTSLHGNCSWPLKLWRLSCGWHRGEHEFSGTVSSAWEGTVGLLQTENHPPSSLQASLGSLSPS